ncbi:tetraacyldisaccharide 4'-kinase [Maricaulaceae bacterium EIL42A08]|nr:tetraacyldisaccharide 4'-kinase [Maricaulaceae bacterium EIL42A08]
MRPPAFWDTDAPRSSAALTRALLSPLGWIYAAATARRIANTTPARAPVPVICVGNITVGGTGKTPVAIALLDAAIRLRRTPAALSRGWKGKLATPARVDPAIHTASDVGDEPLLLARTAPTYIDPGRIQGAHLSAEDGADLIVMDDGHQNPNLEKTLSIVVVDAVAGWGANKVVPAGPLREPVRAGLARADAVIVMTPGPDFQPDCRALQLEELEIPVLTAWLEPGNAAPEGPVLAFAGIGRPQKFFDALKASGAKLADAISFPDHHTFSRADIERLRDLAEDHGATLITTEKDWVRLPGAVQPGVTTWPVRATFAEPARVEALIEMAVERFKAQG